VAVRSLRLSPSRRCAAFSDFIIPIPLACPVCVARRSYALDDARRADAAAAGADSVATELVGPDLGTAAAKWHGGALADDGCIYCAPYRTRRVLRIDPGAATAEPIGSAEVVSTGAADGEAGWAGAVAWGGMVWCIPHGATRFLRVDPAKIGADSGVEPVGEDLSTTGLGGRWQGGVLKGDAVYLIPDTATRVVRFDLNTLRFAAIGDTFVNSPQKWCGGAIDRTGLIFCAPRSADHVLMIDPAKQTATLVGDSLESLAPGCDNKWNDAVSCYWGGVAFIPADAPAIAIFDPKTKATSSYPRASVGGLAGPGQFCGGVVNAGTGGVYCIPYNAPRLVGIHAAVTANHDKRRVLMTLDPQPDAKSVGSVAVTTTQASEMLALAPSPPSAAAARPPAMEHTPRNSEPAVAAPAPLAAPEVFAAVRDRSIDVLTPPPHWGITSLQAGLKVVDVTAEMQDRMQALMDATCNATTLGSGRNVAKEEAPYSRLKAVKVSRIESPDIWRLYAAQRETMLAQLRPHRVERVAVKTRADWMLPELDPQVNEV